MNSPRHDIKEWQNWLRIIRHYFLTGDICPLVVSKSDDNRLYGVINILENSCIGLLDSGATRTVISESFARQLKSFGLESHKAKPLNISTADGTSHSITEIFDVPVSFNNQFHVISMLLVPGLSQKVILGKDFFDLFGIVFNFKSNDILTKSEIDSITMSEPAIVTRDDLSVEEQGKLSAVVEDMKQRVGIGLGRTHLLQHSIDTGNSKPIYQKQYPYSPAIKKQIEEELDEMLRKDVVEPSYSPWCSPIVMVPKSSGSKRLCLDSRQLNKVTKRDTYPLPRVSAVIDNLRNAKFLSTIDLKSAFWQIPLEETSKEKTAFAVPGRGLFHFKVMPFGLVNASQSQQRLMDMLFQSKDEKVWAYLDDIVICSSTLDEHVELLRWVTSTLSEANLSINVDKCKFARSSLRYLGYIIDKDGLRTDPDKVAAILNFPRPKNYTELKRFIGLASWYRRFVKNFSLIAAPLHELTKGRKSKRYTWTEEADKSFTELKTLLTSTPVMTCPDYSKQFIIQCDASNGGVGAVLCQEVDGTEQAVAFLSRKLNDRERKYSTSERELLSVVFAVEKFRPYIDGTHFIVVTDHSALKWLHKMKDPHGRLARWAMKLQQFDFEIIHRPGKGNIVADALSRSLNHDTEINMIQILDKHKDEWYKKKVKSILENKNKDKMWMICDGILFKKIKLKQYPNKDNDWKLYIPEQLKTEILKECHDNATAGHFGIRKTLFKIKQKYFWPHMVTDVKDYVGKCETCAKIKASQQPQMGLMGKHREVTRPWQIISLDLMGPLPRSKRGHTMLLVITCLFSKFSLLFPLRTGKAEKICEILEDQFMLYGAPKCIICDNGRQFISDSFKNLAGQYHCKVWYTPNYHPQSNPTERVNRVIGTAISAYMKSRNHNEWDIYVQRIGHAIRTAVHEATGYTPSYLFFGREISFSDVNIPKLDNMEVEGPDALSYNVPDFDEQLKLRDEIYKEVECNLKQAHEKSARLYDKSRRQATFKVGDIVWKKTKYLSKASDKFTAKLGPKYEKTVITEKLSDNSYRLRNVNGKDIGLWHAKDLK